MYLKDIKCLVGIDLYVVSIVTVVWGLITSTAKTEETKRRYGNNNNNNNRKVRTMGRSHPSSCT